MLFNKKYLHKYQNFFFLLQNDSLEAKLEDVLSLFIVNTSVVKLTENDIPNEVIPVLKKRPIVISRANFYPEYDVFGYKLIYIYDSTIKNDSHKRMSTEKNKNTIIFNLGYFSLELDLNEKELAKKKIQDLTGWFLKEKARDRVALLSPGPENSNVIKLIN